MCANLVRAILTYLSRLAQTPRIRCENGLACSASSPWLAAVRSRSMVVIVAAGTLCATSADLVVGN